MRTSSIRLLFFWSQIIVVAPVIGPSWFRCLLWQSSGEDSFPPYRRLDRMLSLSGFARIQQAPVNMVSQSITATLVSHHGARPHASVCSRRCRPGLPSSAILRSAGDSRIRLHPCQRRPSSHPYVSRITEKQASASHLSAAEWYLQHQAVKTVLLKRLRPNVRPVEERIHNSQTELVLSQCFLHPHLLDAC